MSAVVVTGPTAAWNSSRCNHYQYSLCSYPRRSGHAELAWVACYKARGGLPAEGCDPGSKQSNGHQCVPTTPNSRQITHATSINDFEFIEIHRYIAANLCRTGYLEYKNWRITSGSLTDFNSWEHYPLSAFHASSVGPSPMEDSVCFPVWQNSRSIHWGLQPNERRRILTM